MFQRRPDTTSDTTNQKISAAADMPGKQSYKMANQSKPLNRLTPVSDDKGSQLHVGANIHLKGEITACDTLFVEGKVEASMHSRVINIAEDGVFTGTVEIDRAEISGRFEGDMIVRDKLIIRRTGLVSGNCSYGEIEIEPGGEVSGTVKRLTPKMDKLKQATSDISPPAD